MSDESDRDGSVGPEQDGFSDYDSDESISENGNGLLDMEAMESDGLEDDDDDDDDDDEMAAYYLDRPVSRKRKTYYFPQFSRLPIELRHRIWEFFDLDLRSKGRVFELLIIGAYPLCLWESAILEQQTAPARTMLATNHESRELALKYYPDTLNIRDGSGILRFNADQDIIFLSSIHIDDRFENVVGLIGNARYLAFDPLDYDTRLGTIPQPKKLSPELTKNLKAVFYCYNDAYMSLHRPREWWRDCLGGHHFYIQAREEQRGVGEDQEFMYCWPLRPDESSPAPENQVNLTGLEMQRMIRFSFERGLRLYHDAKALMSSSDVEWLSGQSSVYSESDTEEDEYESEGIDDATIDSDSTHDSESYDGSHGADELGPLDDVDLDAARGIFSLGDYEQNWDGEVAAGRFSSPEPESPDGNDIDSDGSVANWEPIRKGSRRRRRIVSSDDEQDAEDDGADEDTGQQSRPVKRSHVVLTDSEDDDGAEMKKESRPAKRSRIVLSDSEDEDETKRKSRAAKRSRAVLSDSEDDEAEEAEKHGQDSGDGSEEDENTGEKSEDEEPAPAAKPMSLLQKLRQPPRDGRVPHESDDASEESHGSDSDGGGDITFQDDEGDGDGLPYGVDDEDGQLGYMVEGAPEDEFADGDDDW